jgi:hypothetical protein
VHNTKKNLRTQIILNHDNKIVENDKEVANHLNEFFVSVGNPTSSHFEPFCFHRQVPENITFSEFSPNSSQEISEIIRRLENPSAGFDSIKTKFITENSVFFSDFLSKQINIAFQTGKFPSVLKIAKVKPIFKQGDSSNPTNYRPIALLSIFSKIYEICIKNRLLKFISDNKLINPMQFGFIQRSSTTSAASNLLESVIKNLEKKTVYGSTFSRSI